MKHLSANQLRKLVHEQVHPVVSILQPMFGAAPELQQNIIRLKNALRRVTETLAADGMPEEAIAKMLKPAVDFMDDERIRAFPDHSLAMYLTSQYARIYHVPFDIQEHVSVGEFPYIKPLLPILTSNGLFHILAFSHQRIRLFEATRHTIREIAMEELPSDGAALYSEIPEVTLEVEFERGGVHPGAHKKGFGAQAATLNDTSTDLEGYLRRVNAALCTYLAEEHSPLVLACTEELQPNYKNINTYPHLLDRYIHGNPDHLGGKELQKKAWPVVESYFDEPRNEAIEVYHELLAKGRASNDIEKIVCAADASRVATLFVSVNEEALGSFNPTTQQVNISHDGSGEDLLDFAARRAFATGAYVFACFPGEMPDDELIAAIYRY